MDIHYFLLQIINGLTVGSIYALIALGFSMVFGVLKLINFAHSEVFTTGVFLSYATSLCVGRLVPAHPALTILVSTFIAAAGAGVMAVIIQWTVYEPIRNQPRALPIISTIGASFLLQNVAIQLFGAHTRGFTIVVQPATAKLFTIGVLAVCFTTLVVTLQHTTWGIRARATAENPAAVELMGINPSTITTIVFFTGGALAGIAGVCWGLVYGTVNPQMGFEPALKAFMIAALGTAGNLSGTVCIGIGLGIVEALSIGFMPSEYSQFRAALVFATLLTCLVLKPSGIFPQRTERA